VLAAREVSHTRVNHLRGALNDMKKHNMTPVEFFAKMKGLSSGHRYREVFTKDEMVGYIVNCLDVPQNSLASSVDANPGITLDNLYAQFFLTSAKICLSKQARRPLFHHRPTLLTVVEPLLLALCRCLFDGTSVGRSSRRRRERGPWGKESPGRGHTSYPASKQVRDYNELSCLALRAHMIRLIKAMSLGLQGVEFLPDTTKSRLFLVA
jgi:hypothetical protein